MEFLLLFNLAKNLHSTYSKKLFYLLNIIFWKYNKAINFGQTKPLKKKLHKPNFSSLTQTYLLIFVSWQWLKNVFTYYFKRLKLLYQGIFSGILSHFVTTWNYRPLFCHKTRVTFVY